MEPAPPMDPAAFGEHFDRIITGMQRLFETARLRPYEDQLREQMPTPSVDTIVDRGEVWPPTVRDSIEDVPDPEAWLQSSLGMMRLFFDPTPGPSLILNHNLAFLSDALPGRPYRWLCLSETMGPSTDINPFLARHRMAGAVKQHGRG